MSIIAQTVLSQSRNSGASVTLLLFGDVNLGRHLGKDLLKGKVKFPFDKMKRMLHSADGVFVNLESPLTDQNGETVSPVTDYIFCGPPEAARSLKLAGVTVVSTANNHAFDYGLKGLQETLLNLDREGIRHVGTSPDSGRYFAPAILRVRGINVGFLAYTEFVNARTGWRGRISLYDSVRARREIGRLKRSADIVMVSFHGGSEYSEAPGEVTLKRLRSLLRAGADIVVGHHPHVPQGVEVDGDRVIFYSLGNFVFSQTNEWARRSYGVELKIRKLKGRTRVESVRLFPIRPSKQPTLGLPEAEFQALLERLQKTSLATVRERQDSTFIVTRDTSYQR